jgi:hypothetical protein
MDGKRDWFAELVTAPLRDEVGKAIGKVTAPVHAKLDQVATDTARKVMEPVHKRVDEAVSGAADEAVKRLTKLLWPGRRRR